MKIYQPMLYVGLGGTGCQIGTELERRMREELCGPDGRKLMQTLGADNYLPFQLPSCLQFAYADLNEEELTRVRRRVVPSEEHMPAADRTQHLVHSLVPAHDSYPEVALSLRINAGQYVQDWLPPSTGEPRVAPLIKGAGQLPTVGRAALFETMRHGIGTAQQPILDAVGKIMNSGEALRAVGGKFGRSCDVFVAFSVAGGTGCGIFYDYLHLIADAFDRTGIKAQIYPLVLMPSAFADGMGGGRRAELNAGRALLDLFRLVDDQNGQAAVPELSGHGLDGSFAVNYPSDGQLRMRAATMQTAFLISRSAGVDRDDLHRSLVSLMLSMVGTAQAGSDNRSKTGERAYQSFADDFVNRGVEREIGADSGVGSRGVSTGLVASVTVPVDDLADIITSRLLTEAVDEMAAGSVGETNRDLIYKCFSAGNLDALRQRAAVDIDDPPPARGTDAVLRALRDRVRTMEAGIVSLEQRLSTQMPGIANGFDQRRAAEHLLGEVDVFRLRRIIDGDPNLRDPADQAGFARLLEGRRNEPAPPAGLTMAPPQPDEIKGKMLRSVRSTDPAVANARKTQDSWYEWRTHRAWNAAWNDNTPKWDRKLKAMQTELRGVTDVFREFARMERARFSKRVQELYRPRIGVSYLLPPLGTNLELFYQNTVQRFIAFFVAADRLRPAASPAMVVDAVIGAEGWRTAYKAGCERGPSHALSLIRDKLKQEVKRIFLYRGDAGDLVPLLPPLADLLAASVNKPGVVVGDEDLTQFRGKLAGLVPGGFEPQGSGPMKVLISYAAPGEDKEIEQLLKVELHLPRGAGVSTEFRPVDHESIVVVLFRTSMGVTEVTELRQVLRHWADAVHHEQPQDFLKWRQRLGHDFGYLMTTEEHRVRILHHLLCALWNGQVSVVNGNAGSPERVRIQPDERDGLPMIFDLQPFGQTSSWGSLVRAYEEWTLADDRQIRRDVCAKLMTTVPHKIESTPDGPHKLYQVFLGMAAEQDELLARMKPSPRVEMLRTLWGRTLPAALDMKFERVNNPVYYTLRELEEHQQ
jgi:hypothetical protein